MLHGKESRSLGVCFCLIHFSDKDSNGSWFHDKVVLNLDFSTFRVGVSSVAISVCIDTQIPVTGAWNAGQCDRNIFPVRIDRNADQIIAAAALIVSGKTHGESVRIWRKIGLFGVDGVCMDRIHAAYSIRKPSADDRVTLAELDHETEKVK